MNCSLYYTCILHSLGSKLLSIYSYYIVNNNSLPALSMQGVMLMMMAVQFNSI